MKITLRHIKIAAFIVGAVAGLVQLSNIKPVSELRAPARFDTAIRQLARDAQTRAADASTLQGQDDLYVWYATELQKLIREQDGQGRAGHQKTVKVLGAIYDDVLLWMQEASVARSHRRHLFGLRLTQYTQDETYADARSRAEWLADYLTRRDGEILAKKEVHRQLITDSGLNEFDRATLWQPVSHCYERAHQEMANDAQKAGAYRTFIELIDFLHAHKRDIREGDGTIEFMRKDVLEQYQVLAMRLKNGT